MSATRLNETEDQEREHLAHVSARIAAELAAYAAKVGARHGEARELVTQLQENKADMDHVEKASMRQSVTMMTRITEHGVAQQRRLTRLVQSPYFGRIDIRAESTGQARPIYIGIHSFHDADADEQLVHDWRAPVSSMFYEFELGQAHYDAPSGRVSCAILRKRQYRIEERELVFMLESSLNIQDDVLQEELSRASDEKMRNIVATIQRDQNAIIRNDRAPTLIIQGAAGSGKTSIALHRIAFLLYKHKDTIRSEDILIISPNRVFAHYISQVLPELGEEMIQETTMEELAARILGHQTKFQTFSEQVSTLLAGRDAGYAERVAFKATADLLQKFDAYSQHIRATNFTATSIAIGVFTLPAEWVAARYQHYQGQSIQDQIAQIVSDVVKRLQDRYGKEIVNRDRAAVRAQVKAMFSQTTLKALYKNFYTWLDAPEMFKQLKGGRYEYADVFPLIYLRKLVEPTAPIHRIKHVVIDEMQDYTPVQYQVIANLYPCRKTILGDRNQSVSPVSASSAESIAQVLDDAECVHMHKSYRSSLQITKLAQTIHRNPNLIPIERHGEMPAIVACDNAAQEIGFIRRSIKAFLDSRHNSLGVICKTHEQAERLYAALGEERQHVHLLDTRSTTFSSGVVIATAFLAKGLEFDQVLVPFCDQGQYHSVIDRHMLYVACTRAMHTLNLSHTGERSRFLEDALRHGVAVERRVVA